MVDAAEAEREEGRMAEDEEDWAMDGVGRFDGAVETVGSEGDFRLESVVGLMGDEGGLFKMGSLDVGGWSAIVSGK